ncbi:hypothetical protein [Paraburkholderia sp. DGU8]|uniref:hypothetical protein n=1 Tax=Paraburkholderia sp. DGU8 TaxID=3161997 RepID=UPI003465FA99
MNFNELKAALRAEVAGQRAAAGNHTVAKSLRETERRPARVVSVRRSHAASALLKALGAVPNQLIKDAAADSAARRREVLNADRLLGGGNRAYHVVHGGASLTEEEARAACARVVMSRRVIADEAMRIEHCLNEHRAMPAALAAKLF